MADSKISALTELDGSAGNIPASGDFIPIVDTSAVATKKIDWAIASGEIYNVKAYGATGDGATDDAEACQAALDAAKTAGGGVVYFPKGTYVVGLGSDNSQTHSGSIKGGLKIPSNTIVCGQGQNATIIKVDSANYGVGGALGLFSKMPAFINDDIVSGNVNIVIRDLTINGNATTGFAGVATEMEGIDFANVDNFLIENVEITDVKHEGLDIDSSDNGTVTKCYVHGCQGNGCHWSLLSNNGHLVNNIFDTNGWSRYDSDPGAGANVDHSSANGVTQGNIILDGPRGYLQDNSTFRHTFINNQVYWTDTDARAYSSEPLVEVCGGSTVVSGNVITSAGTDATTAIEVKIGNGACQISNNIIAGRYIGVLINNVGGAIVTNNNFTGANYNAGVKIAAASNGRGSIVSGNLFENRATSASAGVVYVLNGAKNPVISNNRFEGNQDDTAAIFTDASGTVISGNTIEGGGVASGIGIEIGANANDCVVYGNVVGLHTTAGIKIVAGSNRTCIYGNNVNDCTVGLVDAGTGTQSSAATGAAANIGV